VVKVFIEIKKIIVECEILEIKCEKIILSGINKWLYTPKRMERISEGISHKKMPHTKNISSSSFPKHINTPYKKKTPSLKKTQITHD
jgi:hypothetical protein